MESLSLPTIMTSIAEIKPTLHKYIADTEDVTVLSKLQDYFASLKTQESNIIAFTSDGRGLTREEYTKDLDDAIAQADGGETIPHEEIEKEL